MRMEAKSKEIFLEVALAAIHVDGQSGELIDVLKHEVITRLNEQFSPSTRFSLAVVRIPSSESFEKIRKLRENHKSSKSLHYSGPMPINVQELESFLDFFETRRSSCIPLVFIGDDCGSISSDVSDSCQYSIFQAVRKLSQKLTSKMGFSIEPGSPWGPGIAVFPRDSIHEYEKLYEHPLLRLDIYLRELAEWALQFVAGTYMTRVAADLQSNTSEVPAYQEHFLLQSSPDFYDHQELAIQLINSSSEFDLPDAVNTRLGEILVEWTEAAHSTPMLVVGPNATAKSTSVLKWIHNKCKNSALSDNPSLILYHSMSQLPYGSHSGAIIRIISDILANNGKPQEFLRGDLFSIKKLVGEAFDIAASIYSGTTIYFIFDDAPADLSDQGIGDNWLPNVTPDNVRIIVLAETQKMRSAFAPGHVVFVNTEEDGSKRNAETFLRPILEQLSLLQSFTSPWDVDLSCEEKYSIIGLQTAPHLNGLACTLLGDDVMLSGEKSGKQVMLLPDGSKLKLRPKNYTKIPRKIEFRTAVEAAAFAVIASHPTGSYPLSTVIAIADVIGMLSVHVQQLDFKENLHFCFPIVSFLSYLIRIRFKFPIVEFTKSCRFRLKSRLLCSALVTGGPIFYPYTAAAALAGGWPYKDLSLNFKTICRLWIQRTYSDLEFEDVHMDLFPSLYCNPVVWHFLRFGELWQELASYVLAGNFYLNAYSPTDLSVHSSCLRHELWYFLKCQLHSSGLCGERRCGHCSSAQIAHGRHSQICAYVITYSLLNTFGACCSIIPRKFLRQH